MRARWSAVRLWTLVAVLLAVVGAVTLTVGLAGQQSAPQPPVAVAAAAPAATATPSVAPVPTVPPAPPTTGAPEPAVPAPVRMDIPALGVGSELLRLGLQDDGTVEVPSLEQVDIAGWYRNSPAPGAVGPAVLLGHVDSAEDGPGIFFELGALRPGAEILVQREDGSVAVFVVDRVARFPKDDFPTLEVYGNTAEPQLRLITCGGVFDSATRDYLDNVVAFATLATVRGG